MSVGNIFKIFKKEEKVEKKEVKKKFNHRQRIDGDKLTEKEKMDKGVNGKTYTINGIEYDFQERILWYLLVLVTLHANGDITVKQEDRFDYMPACEVAAKGRDMYLTNSYIKNKKYVCLQETRDDGN